jgi:two-component system probable response regulator PhcQ
MKSSVPARATTKAGGLVLFVDDEQALLASFAALLRKEPYEVLTADSAMQGMEILARRPVDVVVSDEQMPGTSGSAFLDRVRTTYPHIIRIMLTGGVGLNANRPGISEEQLYSRLNKPVNRGELTRTLRDAIQMKRVGEHDLQRLAAIVDRKA